ncbi:class I SAM-dependent methyltransferase [Candidatus Parcubacteria bacterium]|nr:MAG: class I SAM-dependent methyltransferase [Candidatus Parcubacteria bacterium]
MRTHAPSKTATFAHPRRNVAALGIEPGMLVADFGSGSGAYTLAIADRLEGLGHVYAIDIQRDLLRRIANEAAKLGHKNVEVIWADLEIPRASKLAGGTLDFVLISNLLFQVPDKGALLSEARRILKASGRLAIVDWSESFKGMGPIEEDVVPKQTALELARKAGFELVKEFPAGAHHYGLIMRPVAVAK